MTSRTCGRCTACCVVPELVERSKPMWQPCDLLKRGKPGCKAYDDRPAPCRAFACHWLQGVVVDESGRPDKCGVMTWSAREEAWSGVYVAILRADAAAAGWRVAGELESRGHQVRVIREAAGA